MASVTVQGVTKQFGTQIVLEDVSFELHAGEVTGLVGANGAGKTTLFRLISGALSPDSGAVTRAKDLQIGYLEQEPAIRPERTLFDEVGAAFATLLSFERQLHALSDEMASCDDPTRLAGLMEDYDRVNTRFIAAGGHTFEARMNEILSGLGFVAREHGQLIATMSGGQRCRAALARLLLEDRTLLLMDEPTNHLDIDAVRWLERFLAGHRGGAVIVSHDRYLLDRLCDRILELEYRRVTSFPGNYTNYVQTRAVRDLTAGRRFEQDQAFIKKERAFIAKHLAGQRSAEAKGRRTRLERRLKAGEFTTEDLRKRAAARISFPARAVTSGDVLRCADLAMSYGEKRLFEGLDVRVAAGDRLGITGPNGTGKTTLLRIITGDIEPDRGTVVFEQRVTLGYYAQDQRALDPARTVVDEIRAARGGMSEQAARNYLALFLFRGDDVFKRIETLSGGEQSRVRLATLILESPDVLILDEPTNHLDIASREALESALEDYPGAIIAVSHDRYFLDRTMNRLLVMRPEGCTTYAGGYSLYLTQTEAARTAASDRKTARKQRQPARIAKPKSKSSPYDRMSVEELELLVIEHETELARLQEGFGDPSVLRDPEALAELRAEIEEVERQRCAVDAAWQDRADDG